MNIMTYIIKLYLLLSQIVCLKKIELFLTLFNPNLNFFNSSKTKRKEIDLAQPTPLSEFENYIY